MKNRFLIIAIILVAFMVIKKESKNQPIPLRVITYNVWKGFEDAPERHTAFIEWMKEQNPDIVALQELNGYTEEKLRSDAEQWGHPYSAIYQTKTGYHLGLTSVKPIEIIKTNQNKMTHGLQHCRTSGIDLFNTHLSPFTYIERQNEISFIIDEINQTENKNIILLGDLNALSPKDSIQYLATTVHQYFIERDSIYDSNSNLNNGKLDYSIISVLDKSKIKNLMKNYHPTFPTQCKFESNSFSAYSPEAIQNISRRIDYIYASSSLAISCVKADVVTTEKTNMISDHFPIIAEFNF